MCRYRNAEFLTFTEGLCVQIMHIGPFDDEDKTLEMMKAFVDDSEYDWDYAENRHHHEIYLSDPRKSKPENLKTVIRLPIRERG